ncbi:glycosyltransferase family 2 protein [Pediococcus pentosaceus]|uniref:glycosyltransferase family 2 protein n=1 Tax=Pediococcus pentosaceus TaxID=1255 RepID=UPI002F2624CA
MDISKIAVIMSTYNGEKYISEQINSILYQELEDNYDLNIYVRDDGSTDNTKEVLKDISDKTDRVHILKTEHNLGVRLSFFELLNSVEADYYFFADQDDVWKTNKIKKFMEVFQSTNKNDLIGVYSDLELVDKDLKKLGMSMMESHNWSYDEKRSFDFLIFHYRVTGASFAINRKVRDVVTTYNENEFGTVNMHDSFIALLIAASNGLHFIPEKLVKYRQHDGNVIGAYSKKTSKLNFKSRANGFRAFFEDLALLLKRSNSLNITEKNKLVLQDTQFFVNANGFLGKLSNVLKAKSDVWKTIGWKNVLFLTLFY